MTDRLKGLNVVFEDDIREDDAQALIIAIRQLRGVANVRTVLSGAEDWMNRDRVRRELRSKLLKVLDE